MVPKNTNLVVYFTTHSDIWPFGVREYRLIHVFLFAAHSARYWSAHHTWQTRLYTQRIQCIVLMYGKKSFGQNKYTYLHLVILVAVSVVEFAIPVSALFKVFYHWDKFPHKVSRQSFVFVYIVQEYVSNMFEMFYLRFIRRKIHFVKVLLCVHVLCFILVRWIKNKNLNC